MEIHVYPEGNHDLPIQSYQGCGLESSKKIPDINYNINVRK